MTLEPPRYPSPAFPPDPDFLRASEWLGRPADAGAIANVLGIPFAALSLSKARCDLLPDALRKEMISFSTYSPTLEMDLSVVDVADLGDVEVGGLTPERALDSIREACSEHRDVPLAIIGGDNSITAAAMLGVTGPDAGLITFDAHHDLRDYRRDGLSNGSPVRVLVDEGVKGDRIWQIGIKDFANSRVYSDLADATGINVVRLPEVRESGVERFVEAALEELSDSPVYVDVDIDVCERALAPGAPAAQPGGLHPSQLAYAAFLCGRHPSVRALDIVEVDPTRDVAATTVRVACLVLLSFLAGVARR